MNSDIKPCTKIHSCVSTVQLNRFQKRFHGSAFTLKRPLPGQNPQRRADMSRNTYSSNTAVCKNKMRGFLRLYVHTPRTSHTSPGATCAGPRVCTQTYAWSKESGQAKYGTGRQYPGYDSARSLQSKGPATPTSNYSARPGSIPCLATCATLNTARTTQVGVEFGCSPPPAG